MRRQLINYLPDVIKDTREYKAIMNDGEQVEIDNLWSSIDIALMDQFVADSTVYGVRRWEKILGILPKNTESLDDRKFRILLRLNEALPYTYRQLCNQLDEIVGVGNYSVKIFFNRYLLRVRIDKIAASRYDDVDSYLRRITPANMVIDLDLQFTKHQELQPYTHEFLSGFTHDQIRNREGF